MMLPTLVDSGAAALAALREAEERGAPFDSCCSTSTCPRWTGSTGRRAPRRRDARRDRADDHDADLVGSDGDAARCRDMGIAAYLIKPVRQSALRDAILRALDAQRDAADMPRRARQPQPHLSAPLKMLLAEDNVGQSARRDRPAREGRPHGHAGRERPRGARRARHDARSISC